MTPQKKILWAVKNLPNENAIGFEKDFEKVMNFISSVATYKTDKEREKTQRKVEAFAGIIFLHLKQGGMTREDWTWVDRAYWSVAEPHWNQLKCLLEIREEILAICEIKKEA